MKRTLFCALLLAAGGLLVPSMTRVSAGDATTIRFASLTPPSASWGRIFAAWTGTAAKGGLRFTAPPVQGVKEERELIAKLKAGEVDAVGLSSLGLNQIASATSVLQMGGIFADYKQLNYTRDTLASDFDAMFEKQGVRLLGWRDSGFAHIFAKKPILKPEDFKGTHPWVPREESTLPEMLRLIGVTGVPLDVGQVNAKLQAGEVDTVVGPAMAAVALNWFKSLPHMSKEPTAAIVGATLIREDLFKTLTPDQQKLLLESGKKAHAALIAQLPKDDAAASQTLRDKGVTEFEIAGSPAQKEAWKKVNDELLKNMTGKLWTKELLDKVKKTAASAPK